MSTVIAVHGIRSNGEKNVDLLGRRLEEHGHHLVDCNLGYISLFDVLTRMRSRRYQARVSRQLYNIASTYRGAHVIAHSFGCLATLRAMEHGAQFGSVFLFAPAMDVDFLFPHWGCKTWDVIHNPDDRAIRVGSWLRFHDFGQMGLHGSMYAHLDRRGQNHRAVATTDDDVTNHNYAFVSDQLEYWANFIDQRIAS